MSAVKGDRPFSRRPGADQHGSITQPAKVLDQLTAYSSPLVAGQDICMPDQIDIAYGLDAHDADQLAIRLISPEHNPAVDLAVELACAHVWLVPPISRNYAAICLRGGIHDREDCRPVLIPTKPDAAHVTISVVR